MNPRPYDQQSAAVTTRPTGSLALSYFGYFKVLILGPPGTTYSNFIVIIKNIWVLKVKKKKKIRLLGSKQLFLGNQIFHYLEVFTKKISHTNSSITRITLVLMIQVTSHAIQPMTIKTLKMIYLSFYTFGLREQPADFFFELIDLAPV